ncbi:hypothetical protein K432DRAFT_234380 [Lepidopterella palustris CBS 459.81]|uniref:Uncharacterized protein n=1 Tax=Lepidopterella palustris CBS 459.81 TaxID=1314670 RepID=A0A8E2JH21_9PEZI|nr:hypothetical protein K432DRAFT_234380 [Lepidopterella palustris CBS 459.81]
MAEIEVKDKFHLRLSLLCANSFLPLLYIAVYAKNTHAAHFSEFVSYRKSQNARYPWSLIWISGFAYLIGVTNRRRRLHMSTAFYFYIGPAFTRGCRFPRDCRADAGPGSQLHLKGHKLHQKPRFSLFLSHCTTTLNMQSWHMQ